MCVLAVAGLKGWVLNSEGSAGTPRGVLRQRLNRICALCNSFSYSVLKCAKTVTVELEATSGLGPYTTGSQISTPLIGLRSIAFHAPPSGELITNSDVIRTVHNSFARPDPLLLEEDKEDKVCACTHVGVHSHIRLFCTCS